MYQVVKQQADTKNGIEARLAKIDSGYSVGVWDLDSEQYYPPVRIFPYGLVDARKKAQACYEKLIGA